MNKNRSIKLVASSILAVTLFSSVPVLNVLSTPESIHAAKADKNKPLTVKQMKNRDRKLSDKQRSKYEPISGASDVEGGSPSVGGFRSATYNSNYGSVNQYIAANNLQHVGVNYQWQTYSMFGYNTSSGRPTGIVFHYTDNPNNYSAWNEFNYERNGGWQNAFVHTFIDNDNIIETHNPDYGAWGAGPVGNQFFVQFELVTQPSFDGFAKSVNNAAFYTANILKHYGLKPSLASLGGGNGSIWTHVDVTDFLGGTNHSDPIAYLSAWGYDMGQFLDLVNSYYYGTNIGTGNTTTADIGSEVSETNYYANVQIRKSAKSPLYYLGDKKFKPNNENAKKYAGQNHKIVRLAVSSNKKTMGLVSDQYGKGIFWINMDDVIIKNDIVSQRDINQVGTISAGSSMYYNIEGGWNIFARSSKASVTVLSVAKLKDGSEMALIKDATDAHWISKAAVKGVDWSEKENNTNIKSSKDVTMWGHLKDEVGFFKLSNKEIQQDTTEKKLPTRNVKVIKEITTKDNKVFYEVSQNNKSIGLIEKDSFIRGTVDESNNIKSQVDHIAWGKVKADSQFFEIKADKLVKIKTPKMPNQNVKVVSEITTKTNAKFYVVSQNGKNVGVVSVSDFYK